VKEHCPPVSENI